MSIEPAGGQPNRPPSPTDEELLRRIARQDAAAFEQFFDRHSASINGILLRIVRESSAAEELLQEVFLLVWRKADQYSGRGPAMAWMGRLARNRAFDYQRRRGARPQIADSDQSMDLHSTGTQAAGGKNGASKPSHVSSVEAAFEQSWRADELRQALAQIPEEQRIVIELAFFIGLTHQEISDRTELALGTVKSRIRLGMEKLAHLLRAVGYP